VRISIFALCICSDRSASVSGKDVNGFNLLHLVYSTGVKPTRKPGSMPNSKILRGQSLPDS
jgi:hypothetical protein